MSTGSNFSVGKSFGGSVQAEKNFSGKCPLEVGWSDFFQKIAAKKIIVPDTFNDRKSERPVIVNFPTKPGSIWVAD